MKPYLLPRTKCVTMDGYPLSISFCLICPPLISKGRLNNMSEAIISRRGYGPDGKPEYRSEVITVDTIWNVPNRIVGNAFVEVVGAGGYGVSNGTAFYGGGGGWYNNGEIDLSGISSVSITIGIGQSGTGGTTSFGTYLSANGGGAGSKYSGGGSGGSGGGSRNNGGDGYQFGGGGGGTQIENPRGGNGGIYGGGGGSGGTNNAHGGNGGKYGGGGGGGHYYLNRDSNGYGGIGGEYGGNGGNYYVFAKNGTNTININTVPENCRGNGRSGTNVCSGGGGYGGRGGNGTYTYNKRTWWFSISGGGGGGYGGNGSDGGSFMWGGGGGGYGHGADGSSDGGGGGYYAPGMSGGGGYGLVKFQNNMYPGTGGPVLGSNNGVQGVCIIHYYA